MRKFKSWQKYIFLSLILSVFIFTAGCGGSGGGTGGGTGTAPAVTFVIPANGDTGVPVNRKIAVDFSEAMDPLSINTTTFLLKQGTTPVPGVVTYVGLVATFTPSGNLEANTTYTVTITTGARNVDGDSLAGNYVWSFTTGATIDNTAPAVTLVTPVNLDTGIPLNRKVAATFSEGMDPLTITTSTFVLKQGTTNVPGEVTYFGLVATFTPSGNLAANTQYTAVITTGTKDLSGNALATDYVWSFKTGVTADTTAPAVVLVNPANLATDVLLNRKIAANFSEEMDPLSITTTTFSLKKGTTDVPGVVTLVGLVATFTPPDNLEANTTYTATITTGARDLAGNAMKSDYVWSFKTGTALETTPPTITLVNPANLATGVPLNRKINATFSEAMDPLTIVTANFTVTGPGLTPITGIVTYDLITYIATFKPSSDLAPNTTYTAIVTTDARDIAGNALSTDYAWSFKTGDTLVQEPIDLGSARTFAVMARSAVTSTGICQINGDVGVNPGTSQEVPQSQVNGTIYIANAAIIQAQADLVAAYNEVVALSTNAQPLPGNIGGLTFTPGLYTNAGSVLISGGNVTLDAQGDSSAVFIFKIGDKFNTGPGAQVILKGGAKAANVFWQVGSSAILNSTTIFKGNILASDTITVHRSSVIEGRLLAGTTTNGSVTLNACIVSVPLP